MSHLLVWLRNAAFAVLLLLTFNCTENKTIINPAPPAIDHTDPAIAWITPQANAELSGNVALTFTATDSGGIQKISLFCNGSSPADWQITPHTDSLYTLTWDTRLVDDGLYILEVRAWDSAGNLGISPSLVVKVNNTTPPPPEDRTPPEVSWLAPAAGSTLDSTVMLMLMLSDNVGVDSVRLLKNGARVLTLTATGDTTRYEWNTVADSDGVYVWQARAWDAAGNVGETPVLLVRVKNHTDVTPDTKPPVVVWVAPEAGSRMDGLTVLRFQAIDDSEVDSIRVYLNGAMGFEMVGHSELDYAVEWNTTEWADGLYSIDVRVTDAAGNVGNLPAAVMVTVVNHPAPPPVDTTPPDVWWISPDGGTTLQDTVTLRVRVFDESGVDSVHLLKDGALVVSLPPAPRGGTEGGVEYLWNTRADSDGVHLLSALAWDSAGNEGQSQALLVNVDNNQLPPEGDHTPPVIIWLSPEPGDTVEGTVELRFNVLDDDRVDSVKVYLNGRTFQTFANADTLFNYELQWATNETEDGNYIFQVKAWDRSLNVGLSEVVWFHVWNNRPRVIWVPDEYEKIQDAIWHSENGDTIMVRAGEYHERLQYFNKNVSLVSERGPEETTIDGTGYYATIAIGGGQDTTAIIRGFTIIAGQIGISVGGGTSPRIVNNIVCDGERTGIFTGVTYAQIRNNLILNFQYGVEIAADWGDFKNNMILNASQYGFWNGFRIGQPLVPDYNLFWNNREIWNADECPMEWGDHNITDQEPIFQQGTYKLDTNSPGVDQGDPNLQDIDGSKSDIGAYGGPYAYP